MKFVVIGGTGLIGSKLIAKLRGRGHDAVSASPKSGVNTLTGEGLAAILTGADVVVDVSNSPSFADDAVMDFFQTSTRNQLQFEEEAGVGTHVALSIVGAERLPESGYLRAKVAQENLIIDSARPYSLLRATQFFEFVGQIADAATVGTEVRLPPGSLQPMAADDVVEALARLATAAALNGTREVGGPQPFAMPELVRLQFEARGDTRTIVSDPTARYFGALLTGTELVPAEGAELGQTRFEDWLTASS
ncbi:MAG TPA: SDR family oxidoreductase [Pseudolysinimonas sp.]|jgi:uncharacterized protein YbjT (DUF2867 family)